MIENFVYQKCSSGKDYYIPEELQERFIFLSDKSKRAKKDPDHIEVYRGCLVALDKQFSKYKVSFKKGQIWEKKTESWMGNDPKGTKVKIVSVENSFIRFKKTKKILWFNICFGSKYILNKWSFLRIYEKA